MVSSRLQKCAREASSVQPVLKWDSGLWPHPWPNRILGFRLILVALLIGLNGFFAAAEVALLSVRGSRLRQLAAEGQSGAQAALNLLANPARLLSVTQVGVTLCSLGLGWAGEETAFRIFQSAVSSRLGSGRRGRDPRRQPAAAFLAISYLHVVVGEVVPKNLAIATGRPPGRHGGARAADLLSDLHRLRGGDGKIQRSHHQDVGTGGGITRPAAIRRRN